MHSEIPGAAQHLMLLLMARSVLGFIDAQLVMRGRLMVVCVYIHRRAATDVLNLLICLVSLIDKLSRLYQ